MTRRSKRNGDVPPPLPGRRRRGCLRLLVIVTVGLCVLVAGIFMANIVLMQLGYGTKGVLERGRDLHERTRASLEETFLEGGEVVRWFYSAALFDVSDDGTVLTDRRVVRYWRDAEQPEDQGGQGQADPTVAWALLEDIAAIRVKFEGPFFEISEAWIWQAAGTPYSSTEYRDPEDPLVLLLSAMEQDDHAFIVDLVRTARAKGATIVSIEFGGDVSVKEIGAVQGAVRYNGVDWAVPPKAFMESIGR